MKTFSLFTFCLLLTYAVSAQRSAEITPNSITLPRLSTTQQNTLPPQQAGNMIYNADENKLALHDGTNWNYLTSTPASNGFQNAFVTYINGTWTVPSNVEKILVELWGSGADGDVISVATANIDCTGGGGGEYAKYILSVTPNEVLKLVVSSRTNYENLTKLIRGTNTLIAYAYAAIGINGASRVMVNGTESVGLLEFKGGENGSSADFSFQSVNSTTWRKIIKAGAGGGTFPMYKNGGKSSTIEFDVTSGNIIGKTASYYPDGKTPGGGGACNHTGFNGYGAPGMIIIHY